MLALMNHIQQPDSQTWLVLLAAVLLWKLAGLFRPKPVVESLPVPVRSQRHIGYYHTDILCTTAVPALALGSRDGRLPIRTRTHVQKVGATARPDLPSESSFEGESLSSLSQPRKQYH